MGWVTIENDSEIVAIHAALLPTEPDGVVLYFGDWGGLTGNIGVQELTYSRLHHLEDGLADPIEDFEDGDLPDTDVFCGGQSFLADGRLLTAGGTFGWAQGHEGIHLPHYDGERTCWMYLPRAKRWTRIDDLRFQPDSDSIGGGRWYPTVVTLPNGEGFAVGGHPSADDSYPLNAPAADKRHNNNTPERYSPGSNQWTLLTADVTAPSGLSTDGYPRYHLLPGGLLFSATAGKDTGGGGSSKKRLFDAFAGVWTGPDVGGLTTLTGFYDRGSSATSVLLPLLPPSYPARVLACNSPDPTAFRIDVDDSPSWTPTVARTGTAAGLRRDHGCATLLPTGQVLVTGGWVGDAGADDPTVAVTKPELYTPGIDWANGDFASTGDEDWETIEDPAPNRRGYHSTALLLPDGRVWVGGSTTTADGSNKEIDVFDPAYAAGRPTIDDCPGNISYDTAFTVDTPQASSIERVALIRCGSITHGFNSDQRYVGLTFSVKDGNTLSVAPPPSADIAPPGYYMLWLIDDEGRPCERAWFVRVSKQKLVVSADVSTFSIFEVDALGPPSQFKDALYVACEGFLPSEVTAPDWQLLRPDNSPVPGMSASFGPPKYEAGKDQADVAQRIVYPVRIKFDSLDAFEEIPEDQDFQAVGFYVTMGLFIGFAPLQLSKNPNPRMSDGDPPYLSIDLRVFRTNPGDSPVAGIEHPPASDGEAGAYGYIQDVLEAFNDDESPEAAHPFSDLPDDQGTNRLELGTNDVNGDPVFNYAIARVRFVAPEGIDAADVRVFFRMWTTGWTALEYSLSGSYRRFGDGPSATPLLGLRGGEINNVPCFAEAREANMEQQADTTNRRTLEGAGGAEVFGYFGCWLDVNQDVERFPLEPVGNGPYSEADYPDGLRSIQTLMRGLHQCLVAEIHYSLDPIQSGATPGSSDNLAQRNILFDFSDNPGTFAAHLVHHTFELEPSATPLPQEAPAAPMQIGASSVAGRMHPDELAIDWGELPRDALVTFFMPQVDAAEIVRASALRQAPPNLKAVGPGMVACKVTDVGFMPIPGPLQKTIAGLISVQLPPGVPYGKTYKVVLRQISGRSRKVLGTTEFRIQVAKAQELLPQFLHDLAVLKHIALSIPTANRWYPVFERYLAELGDRIRAFGGDPGSVRPSPTGDSHPAPEPYEPDARERFTGRVVRLYYDCFGDFEGFEVEDCGKRRRFSSHEHGIAAVALTACERQLRVTVFYDPDTCRPKRLVLHC
ncbi:MAG TPA: galactose oxidase-like domain-containing protein [Gaiellaceae bacterium]|nr:galactose oxidase-like domain-containing protein [Gaiellaceae bacterium]